MAHGPKQPQTISDCKLKAVNPPLRSVSTPRARKDLRVVGRVNPDTGARALRLRLDSSEWNARRLGKRREEELSRDAWRRLSALAIKRRSTVAQLLEQALSEGQ
jgi:hypothetical protein